MPAMNSENAKGWQIIADMLSKQRPYPGRYATVFRGKKLKGDRVKILRHQLDKFVNVFRYGNAASHHMREMAGRSGYICLVLCERTGEQKWVKAEYLACETTYSTWAEALADAIRIQR